MHNNPFGVSQTIPLIPVHGKTVFHEIGPWCQKDWEPLLKHFPNLVSHLAETIPYPVFKFLGGEWEKESDVFGWSVTQSISMQVFEMEKK